MVLCYVNFTSIKKCFYGKGYHRQIPAQSTFQAKGRSKVGFALRGMGGGQDDSR